MCGRSILNTAGMELLPIYIETEVLPGGCSPGPRMRKGGPPVMRMMAGTGPRRLQKPSRTGTAAAMRRPSRISMRRTVCLPLAITGFSIRSRMMRMGKRPGQRPAGTRSLRKRTSRRTGLLQARHMQTGIRSRMRTMPVRSWKAFPITGQRPLRISMTVPGMRSSMKTSWTRPGISLTTIPWGGSCGWRPAAGSPWS